MTCKSFYKTQLASRFHMSIALTINCIWLSSLVAHAMEIEPKARNFFALCQQLYVFSKRQFASNVYEGQTLKRLLVQRLLPLTILNIFTQVRYLSLSFAAFLIKISYQLLRFTPHGLTLLPHRFLYDIRWPPL